MRPSSWLVLALIFALVGSFGSALSGGAQVSPATPDIVGTPAEVTIEYVGDTEPATAPDHTLELIRITLPPDGGVPPADHPGAAVMFVETGAVEITLEQGSLLLFRRAAGDPGPVAEPEPCPEICRVEAGWSAVQQDFTRHNLVDVSGAGSVVLISQLTANAVAAGTPAATPAAGPGLTPYGCDGGCR